MCQDLCSLNTVKPSACPSFHHGKEVVYEATFRQSLPIMVKARDLDIETASESIVYWTDENGIVLYPTKEEFIKMIENHLSINFNLSLPTNRGIFALWPHSLKKDSLTEVQNEWLLQSSMINIWSLSLDTEYVFSRLYKEYDIFPEVMGTCGGLYFVEQVKPLNMPSFLQRVNFDGWVDRVKLALSILDLLEEFENMFDHPVYLCDIKSEHFGLSEHGRMKYLDVDNVYLKPIADKSVGDGSYCENHSDCDLFDCKGICDLIENKCSGPVVNNNLQVVCEKIFLGPSLGFNMFDTGLLTSKHSNRRLNDALKKCANPSGSDTGERIAAEESTFQIIKSSLKEIVSIHKDLSK